MKLFHSKAVFVVLSLLVAIGAHGTALTDYGSIPAVAKPAQDQAAANQKLDFQTDLFTGRFGYRVPIEVPPARGGLAPNIVLQYNSANKNGWCGVGWDLDMGNIQRETRDGVPVTGSSYADSFGFTFSIAGQSGRLISVGSSNYCPQIDSSFLKCAYSNGWWIATDKSGTKYNFGETTNARITNSLGTFKWALSSVRDANGNKILLTYTNDFGQLYLSRIDYNGNDNSPTIATNCTVAFDLASGNRADTNSTFISGSEIQTRKLLGAIRVLNQGNLVRRYALTYTTSPSTDRTLLQKVQEFGSDNTTALPARAFTYSQQTASFQSAVAWNVIAETGANKGTTYGQTPGTPDSQLIDVNGDGLPDWVTVGDGPYNYYNVQLNTGSGFTSTQYSWSPLSNEGSDSAITWNSVDTTLANADGSVSATCQLMDINGDNLPDRVLRGYSTRDHFQIQTNTGTGWATRTTMTGVSGADSTYQATSTSTSDGEASRSIMIDMNGDGLPDHVMKGSSSGQFDVQLNLGGSFGSTVAWTNVTGDAGTYPYTPRDRGAPDLTSISHVYADIMDMNGDGLPDRVLSSGIQLNNGVRGFGPYQTTWNYSGDPEVVNVQNGCYTTQLIDMNGDGLPDFVNSGGGGSCTVYFNMGRSFNGGGVTWSGVNTSGDGTAGWTNLMAWDSYGTKVMFIDMNGDGLVDRVERNYTGSGSFIVVQLQTGPFPDLLTGVDNGIGGTVTVSYTPSTSYNNSDGTRPRLPFPVYTVSSVAVDDSHGNIGTTTYDYANGYYDTTWREFRGFGRVTETDPLGAYTTTWFHQGGGTNAAVLGEFSDSLSKAGTAFRSEIYGSDNNLYSRTLNKVVEVMLHTNGIYFPFVQQTIKQDFEGNTTNRATASGYAYNAISNNLAASTGNLLYQTNYGEVFVGVISNHAFTVANTVPPVYRQLTYATITGNADIIDHVSTDTLSSDAAGTQILRQSTFQYFSGAGNLQQRNDLICPGTYAATSYTYDNYGNVLTTTDPVGIVSTTDYDSATATFPTRRYTGVLSDNLIEYSQYDSRAGVLVQATDMRGLVTSNAYDVFFRPTNTFISTTPNGAPTLLRQRIEYKLVGIGNNNVSTNFIHVSKNDPADASGFHDTWTYLDGLGRPIQQREESEVSGQYRVSLETYDDRGSVVLETYPFFDSGSNYVKYTTTRTNVYTEYDKIGRAFRINPVATAGFNSSGWWNGNNPTISSGDTGSPVSATSFGFKEGNNPWVVIVTNALGQIHKYYQDAYGRTNLIVEITSQGSYSNSLAYTPVGDLTNITDSAGNKINLYVNLLGQRVAMLDPDMGFWQYGLDAAGRLKIQTDAKGQQQKLFYESGKAGRLIRKEGWSAGGVCLSTNTYTYDSNSGDNAYTVYAGQLFSVTDDEGWQKNSYDVRNRTLKTVRYLNKNSKSYTNQFTFDDADRNTAVVYPNGGPIITNIFDSGLHISQVKQIGGSGIVFFTAKGFNAMGQPFGANFGNGVQTTNNYYLLSKRLNSIVTSKTTNIQSLAYSYDALGNFTNIADNVYSGTNSGSFGKIQYDDLNRLTSLTNGAGSFSYAYDSIGNIKTNSESSTTQYAYNAANRPHAVTNANGIRYLYDLNGNVANRGGMRLVYNVNNQMSAVLRPTMTVQCGYAADGARLWKSNATNSLQVWIGNTYEEKNGQVLFHIYAGGQLVCTFDSTGTNVFQYYHPSVLTSTSIQTDTNGNPTQRFEYSGFGQTRYTQSTSAFAPSRRYTGQVLDDDTGLYYYNFRYYDPLLGRFVQPDDIIPNLSDPQSWNRYAYCHNNPLRFTDPTGHSDENVVHQVNAPVGMYFNPNPVSLNVPQTLQVNVSANFAKEVARAPTPTLSQGSGGIPLVRSKSLNPDVYQEILIAGGASQWLDSPMGEHIAWMQAEAIMTAPGAELTVAKIGQVFRPIEALSIEGGPYRDLATDGMVRHHMPAKSVSPLSTGEGPAIRMTPEDHANTASFGPSREAKAYRAQQSALISQGKFLEAQQMDIQDLAQFGKKYELGIKQVQDYTKTISPEKLKPVSETTPNQ